MAKSPTIKFPRIEAGFYSITKDGELVGYVMKELDSDSKETNWYVFDDNVPEKDIAMLNPADAIDTPDSLLREAKETAKDYFLNKPIVVEEVVAQVVQLNEEDWVEEGDDDEVDDVDDELVLDGIIELDDLDMDDEDELDLDDVECEEDEANLALV